MAALLGAARRQGFALGAVLFAGCTPTPPEVQALSGETMGSTWSVKWVGTSDPEVQGEIEAVLAEVNAGLNTWSPDSDLSRARVAGGEIPVLPATAEVVSEALEIARVSGGAFDPTVQPLMELWGFHGPPRASWPTPEEVETARAQVDFRRVGVRWEGAQAYLNTGGTALDVAAIAPGYAADRISGALAARGISRHMVEVGGEIFVAGEGPSEAFWRVGVDRPVKDSLPGASLVGAVRVTQAGVATSGNYRSYREIEGKTVGHTVDPRTGYPAESDVRAVTVVAPTCMRADGLATVVMVVGAEQGLALLEALPRSEAVVLPMDGAPRATSAMPWVSFDTP